MSFQDNTDINDHAHQGSRISFKKSSHQNHRTHKPHQLLKEKSRDTCQTGNILLFALDSGHLHPKKFTNGNNSITSPVGYFPIVKCMIPFQPCEADGLIKATMTFTQI